MKCIRIQRWFAYQIQYFHGIEQYVHLHVTENPHNKIGACETSECDAQNVIANSVLQTFQAAILAMYVYTTDSLQYPNLLVVFLITHSVCIAATNTVISDAILAWISDA